MIDKNNNFDEIDNMLFSYFDNNKNIPSSTQDTITNAFNIPTKPISLVYKIQKVAIILISFIVLTTGVVFAKDIIKFISSLFTNTTEGIDKAVENGYVQNVDMDFVYDNGIGVKVDYLVMDDSNLDVSFVYDAKNYTDVESVALNEYIIRDENNNVIYYNLETTNEKQVPNSKKIATDLTRTNESAIKQSNIFRESLLYSSEKFPNSKNLIFELLSFYLGDKKVNGYWIFTINLENKIIERNTTSYNISYNNYIENISTNLTDTTLKIHIDLNKELNNEILIEPNNICLQNNLGEKYQFITIKSGNKTNPTTKTISTIDLEFDISKYFKNIENLNLYIKFNTNEIIDIKLTK